MNHEKDRPAYLQQLQQLLPAGVELFLFDPHGLIHIIRRGSWCSLDPVQRAADRQGFLRFIDEGHFTRYLIGHASTSDLNPANATFKLGMMRPHSAFTPHAHGTEHFVLSMGYASCGLHDEQSGQIVHVRLFPGALLYIPAMMPHSFNNRAGDPLLLLVSNTGMGIDHENYAITAAQAEQRTHCQPEVAASSTCSQNVNYAHLSAALRCLEREMPDATTHAALTWREWLAKHLRELIWRLESS